MTEPQRTPDLCKDCNVGEHSTCDFTLRREADLCGCTSNRHEPEQGRERTCPDCSGSGDVGSYYAPVPCGRCEASGVVPEGREQVDRYWYVCGPDGWSVETWRGEPAAENVVTVGRVTSLEDAESLVAELNAPASLRAAPSSTTSHPAGTDS